MNSKTSPLAPRTWPDMARISGVTLGSIEAGIKYAGRKDLTVIHFENTGQIAGVFTKSKCPSAPVDWCRKILPHGNVKCIVVNSGNANAFTGVKGAQAVEVSANAAASIFNCDPEEVYLASTGVIGEPLDASDFPDYLTRAKAQCDESGWDEAANAIMTTDTYHKTVSVSFDVDSKSYHLNGIAKGSGMIAPDMATMLSFLVTDLPVTSKILQQLLNSEISCSFNAITVDSDTSTSDTVLLASSVSSGDDIIDNPQDHHLTAFSAALRKALNKLAMLVVRDGEGASKHIEICVEGASSHASAKKIALSIANSPLVKTAIAGEDANWGRIVMAIGKAGEPADRDLVSIWFGDLRVALNGERDPDYNEDTASDIMKNEFIPIKVSLGIGEGHSTVWTCDLTREYVNINADYRS